MRIKIISWNIWHGKHLEEIIRFLREHDADIIGLQEVRDDHFGGKRMNTAMQLADELGYTAAYYQTFKSDPFDSPDRTYDLGSAVLSRLPILKTTRHQLSGLELYRDTAETEPRIAVEAQIDVGGTTLNVVSTHLAYSDRFKASPMRDLQADNLLNLLPKEKTVLMGDFNSQPDSDVIKRVAAALPFADKVPVAPSWTAYPYDYQGFKVDHPCYRVDYIFVSRDLSVHSCAIGDTRGSDHLPVLAVIDV